MRRVYLILFGSCMCFTLTAWGMSQFPQVGLESWQRAMEHYQIQNTDAFRRVAVIHFAGYLGAGVGLILALWDTRTQVRQSQNQSIKMLNEENKAGQGVTE